MNGWVDGWVRGWVGGLMGQWMTEWMDGWWVDRGMGGLTDGQVDGFMVSG